MFFLFYYLFCIEFYSKRQRIQFKSILIVFTCKKIIVLIEKSLILICINKYQSKLNFKLNFPNIEEQLKTLFSMIIFFFEFCTVDSTHKYNVQLFIVFVTMNSFFLQFVESNISIDGTLL